MPGQLYFKPALENVIYKMVSPKKRQLAYKFDCSGKDIDVSVNEADPNKNDFNSCPFIG